MCAGEDCFSASLKTTAHGRSIGVFCLQEFRWSANTLVVQLKCACVARIASRKYRSAHTFGLHGFAGPKEEPAVRLRQAKCRIVHLRMNSHHGTVACVQHLAFTSTYSFAYLVGCPIFFTCRRQNRPLRIRFGRPERIRRRASHRRLSRPFALETTRRASGDARARTSGLAKAKAASCPQTTARVGAIIFTSTRWNGKRMNFDGELTTEVLP